MPALKLLILDANEVIYLHETGLWQTVLSRCEVFLARTVAEDEAKFYRGTEADEIIDVSVDISAGRVKVFEQTPTELKLFFDRFDPMYHLSLDPGEAESLAYLVQSKDSYLISSGDAIVFRVLGLFNRSDQGYPSKKCCKRSATDVQSPGNTRNNFVTGTPKKERRTPSEVGG